MRPSNLIALYRLRLRAMVVQELLAVVGIAVGVSLVFAALVANTSLTGSVRQLSESVVGDADLQLTSRGAEGFDAEVLTAVRRTPGVEVAAPIVEARANVVGPRGRRSVFLIGGDHRFIRLADGLMPDFTDPRLARQQAIALPTTLAAEIGLSLGQPAEFEVGGRVWRVPLGIQLQERDVGDLVGSPVALAPLEFAQRLAGLGGRVSRVFVDVSPGREGAVRRALRGLREQGLNVVAADADVRMFERAAYPTSQSTTLFSVLSALVGFLFAFSAVLLTVPQRRRLVADLRLAGHEGWVLVELLLFDALVLGTVASIAGLALGDQLSRHLFESTPGYLAAAFAIGTQRVVTWESVAIAVGSGFLAAALAVLVPLRPVLAGDRPRRRRPRAATVGLAVWSSLGLLCLAIATTVIVAVPRGAIVGLVALTIALLCLLPGALRLSTATFRWLTRRLRTPVPTLAAMELSSREARPRALALAATGAVAVFAIVAIGGAQEDLERGLDDSARTIDSSAHVWVTLSGETNALATTSFETPRRLVRSIEAIDGVRGVAAYRGTFLDVRDRRAWVIAPPRTSPTLVSDGQILEGSAERASARLRGRGWVVLSESVAEALDAEVGDAVTLPTPAPRRLRVAALSNNLGWPPGAIVLNADDYAAAWGSRSISAIAVRLEPATEPARIKSEVERRVGSELPVDVETVDERTRRHYATADDGLSRLSQISAMVVIAAVVAMATTMAGMIWQRRVTFAQLKVSGFSQRDLWTALMVEGAVLMAAGCLLGALFGFYGQVLLTRALAAITGFPVSYCFAGTTALATLLALILIVAAMLAVPGWLAVRVRPAPGRAA